jgi:hypothetical protein
VRSGIAELCALDDALCHLVQSWEFVTGRLETKVRCLFRAVPIDFCMRVRHPWHRAPLLTTRCQSRFSLQKTQLTLKCSRRFTRSS